MGGWGVGILVQTPVFLMVILRNVLTQYSQQLYLGNAKCSLEEYCDEKQNVSPSTSTNCIYQWSSRPSGALHIAGSVD